MRRTPYISILLVSVVLIASFGCRTESEKIERVAKNFVLADYVYAAPYRSYLFISPADKQAMTLEEYADWHAREPLAEDTPVEVISIEPSRDRATTTLKVGDLNETLVLSKDERRWRVHLGLAEFMEVRDKIDSAKRHRADGDLDAALQGLVQADLNKAESTLSDALNQEVADLREAIEAEEQAALIRKRFDAAKTAPLGKLEEALTELRKIATGQEWRDELAALEGRRSELRLAAARQGLKLNETGIRRFYEGNAIVHELDATIVNESSVPVKSVSLVIDMIQSGDSLGARTIAVPLEGVLEPGQSFPIDVRIPNTEVGWKSREFESGFEDVEVAND